jgi:GAF domain-containing protein
MTCDANRVLLALAKRAGETRDPDRLAEAVVSALKEGLAHCSWAGVYWLEGEELVLGPFVGAPTEHRRIPVGRGVCGTAVSEDRDQVVEDVRQVTNYLACSAAVRSEMVVLIRCMGRVVGQIDLDSEDLGAFGPEDLCVVRAAADGLAGLLALGEDGRLLRMAASA